MYHTIKEMENTQAIDYSKMMTRDVVLHIARSIEAARYEGNDTVYYDSDSVISLFSSTLTVEQYAVFNWDAAEDYFFAKAEEMENS